MANTKEHTDERDKSARSTYGVGGDACALINDNVSDDGYAAVVAP
jgi:hypothetical protein